MKTYLDSLSLCIVLVVTSNFTLGHMKISYYSTQKKKIQRKKKVHGLVAHKFGSNHVRTHSEKLTSKSTLDWTSRPVQQKR